MESATKGEGFNDENTNKTMFKLVEHYAYMLDFPNTGNNLIT